MLNKAKHSQQTEPRIQSLARADSILGAVMAHDGPISLGALSEALGLNKTTVFNLAESLALLGFLDRTSQPKGYRLGLRCVELGRRAAKSLPLLEVSRQSLRELCQKTGETVNLAAPYLQEAIILEALQSHHAVRATAYAGARSKYHSSACGKAIFAHLASDQRQWVYESAGLPRLTEHTICDVAELEADLAAVRERGYALDNQENEIGAYCVAMPIFGPFNEVVGSISVSGVIQRMTPQLVDEVIGLLRQHTAQISQALRPN